MDKTLAIVLGIRPDVIRASIILQMLRDQNRRKITFIWSGQHYSDNLKDIFFRQLAVQPPDIELNARGSNDAQITSDVISKLYPVLEDIKPQAVVFLGDTNTVAGCLAAAQLNIPIVHIEGCMRSYDWRMPEEKYRTIIDHLSDVIYAYLPRYRQQGIDEGLNPANIIVTGNPIVDVLKQYYFGKKSRFDSLAPQDFFTSRGIEKNTYYLMTCHRRENISMRRSLENILSLAASAGRKIFFTAGYRTQDMLKQFRLSLPPNVIITDPVGYTEMLILMTNSCGIITDSGTIVEEACILKIPSIQMRKSTERPEVYDVGASIKFDPACDQPCSFPDIFTDLEDLYGRDWENPFGDGLASQRITEDLLHRLDCDGFSQHQPNQYHLDISASFKSQDSLPKTYTFAANPIS